MILNDTLVYIVREPVGGIWKHIELLIKYFKLKHKIIIIGNLKNGDKNFLSFQKEYSNIEYFDIDISRQPSLSDFKNIIKIRKYLKNKNIYIIHGHGAKGGIYARLLKVFSKNKIVYTPHGGSVHNYFGIVQTLFYRLIESTFYFMTDKIVAESEYTMNSYKKILLFDKSSKIVVNHNGINCSIINKLEFNGFSKPIDISSFGMLRYMKGQDILIRAIKKLIDKGLDIKLNLYGNGEDKIKYQTLIKTLSMEKNIFLHGEINNVEYIMRTTDIIIQPSRFESFGYVLIEAMSVGKPVIASATGGMIEIIEDNENGLLFKNEDVDDLVKKILFLINNQEQCNKLILNGYKTVIQRFNQEDSSQRLEIIYSDLFNQK